MRDVSPAAVLLFRFMANAIQLPLEELYQGLADPTVAERDGLDWEPFCAIIDRLTQRCGGLAALAVQGAIAMRVPSFGPIIRIFRMLAGTRELYWANVRWGGPSLFRLVRTTFRVLPDGRYCATLELPRDRRSCEGFFYINAGVFTALPRAFGLPDAHVDLTVEGHRGTYVIVPPPALSALARLRLRLTAIATSRQLVERLIAQNEHLTIQSAEARRARADADAARARAESALLVAQAEHHAAEEARANAELARREAVAALQVKSEFVSTVSHELRTPLNGILGMTQLVLASPLTPLQRDSLETVQASGEVLLRLINDILDFSKMEAGHLTLDPVDTDVRALVKTTIEGAAAHARANDKGVRVRASIDPAVPRVVRIDGLRLRQVVTNLLDNAVKFTERGEVTLALAPVPGREALRCTVRDTGIGITPEQRQRIFAPFVQADGSTTRRFGGTGLGLAICAKLVTALGGTIEVDSAPGVGSTFSFCFDAPMIEAAPAEVPDEPAPAPDATSPAPAPTPDATSTPRRRVLLHGGDALQQRLVNRLVARLGHEPAEDAEPDVVLLPVTGDDLERSIASARERWSTARLVAIAAPEHHAALRAWGAHAVVDGPIALGALANALAAAV